MCDITKEVGNLLSSVGGFVTNTIESIIKNPLPVIETVALTSIGVPPIIASATVSAVNGGNLQTIATNALASYAGAQIGQVAGNITGSTLTTTDWSPDTQALVKQVVTSASGSAATAALKGQNFDQILASAASGGIGAAIQTELKQNLNLDPSTLDSKLISNSVTAATKAILGGKSVSDAIAQSATATALSASISSGVDYLKKNSDTVQSLSNNFNDVKQTATDYFNNILSPLQNTVQDQYKTANVANTDFTSQQATLNSLMDQYNTYKDAVSSNAGYNNYLVSQGWQYDDANGNYVKITGYQDIPGGYETDDSGSASWVPAHQQPIYDFNPPSQQTLATAANALVPQINSQATTVQTAYDTAKAAAMLIPAPALS